MDNFRPSGAVRTWSKCDQKLGWTQLQVQVCHRTGVEIQILQNLQSLSSPLLKLMVALADLVLVKMVLQQIKL